MSRHVARLFLLLGAGFAAAPISASPLVTSGPGFAECAEGHCLDLGWEWNTWDDPSTSASGASTLNLLIPDPNSWVLDGGYFSMSASVSYQGSFHFDDYREYRSAGNLSPLLDAIGADGSQLARISEGLMAMCYMRSPGETATTCGDGNGAIAPRYYAIANDPAFQGALTLRYDYHPALYLDPISNGFYFAWGGNIHLVYTAVVPEPGGAAILATGMLVLAAARKL
jgi:hypothetical protein